MVEIPEDVSIIELCAFEKCDRLSKVVVSGVIEDIGDWTFSGCEKLSNIVFNRKVNKIGDRIFKNCTSIKSIEFNGGLKQGIDKKQLGCNVTALISIRQD